MSLWLWDVDTQDWMAEGSGSSYWVHRIVSLAESEGGALQHPVVLMHNQAIPMPATVAALPIIIQFFQSHGYKFVDLLGRSGPPSGCGSAPPTQAAATVEPEGFELYAGSSASSPEGQYRLAMQRDGNLVFYVGNRALWASGTVPNAGARATMQKDGNFVVYDNSGTPIWSSRTAGHPGATLSILADGRIDIMYRDSTLWSTGTSNSQLAPGETLQPAWYLETSGTACRLIMQKLDGNLVLYSASGRAVWASGTVGNPGAHAIMQGDGNLVIYSASSRVLWSTGGQGLTGSSAYISRDASAFIETPAGSVAWWRS